jgi:hypothetical protein
MTIGAFHALVIARRGCSSSFGAFVFLNGIDGAGQGHRSQDLHERAALGWRELLNCRRVVAHERQYQGCLSGKALA